MTMGTTPPALVSELTRAQKVTEAALSTFSKASIASSSVLTGIFSGSVGLGGCFAFGISHHEYASNLLNACSFVAAGALGMLGSRMFGPAKRREAEEQRRIDFNFSYQALAIQTETLKSLSGTISPAALDSLVGKAALTFDSIRIVAQGEEPGQRKAELSLPPP